MGEIAIFTISVNSFMCGIKNMLEIHDTLKVKGIDSVYVQRKYKYYRYIYLCITKYSRRGNGTANSTGVGDNASTDNRSNSR